VSTAHPVFASRPYDSLILPAKDPHRILAPGSPIFHPWPQIGTPDMDESLILALSICAVALFYLLVFVVSRHDKR
jgi:hypothetical protein